MKNNQFTRVSALIMALVLRKICRLAPGRGDDYEQFLFQ